jgi:nucleoside-diphosphate-sugar epimerase
MLVDDGHQVFALKRNPKNLPDGLQPIRADLTLPETLVQLPNGIDYVFYTAGATARAGRADERSYRESYLDGMGRLLSTLSELGEQPKRMFFTSSTSVYDQRRGEWVDEDSHTAPSSFRGDMMLMTERLMLADPIPSTVVRFGGIYGPGRDRLARGVLNGEIGVDPGEPHFTNRIHRDDAAGCLRHLMSHSVDDIDLDDIYLGVDHEAAEETVVLRWLADRLAVKLPEPDAGDSQAKVRRTGSKRCRNQRLTTTGYRFVYPTFREGYEMVIRDWPERKDGS